MIIASRRSRFARLGGRKSKVALVGLTIALLLGLAIIPASAVDVPGLGLYTVGTSPDFCEDDVSCTLTFTFENIDTASLDVLTVAEISAPENFELQTATAPANWSAAVDQEADKVTFSADSPTSVNGVSPGN
ncbi:MAG: hypothetical protein ACRD1T_01830, partial [Acidimicrobiia bacterium]